METLAAQVTKLEQSLEKQTGERVFGEVLDDAIAVMKTFLDSKLPRIDDQQQKLETQLKRLERKVRKDRLHGAAFSATHSKLPLDQVVKKIGLDGRSFVVGDAAVSPNFH